MTDDKMKQIGDLLAANNLRKALEENDKAIHERGFVPGARVKCKKASFFNAKGFIVSVTDAQLTLRWEDEDGNSFVDFLPEVARKIDGRWLVHTNTGMEELKLWGTW